MKINFLLIWYCFRTWFIVNLDCIHLLHFVSILSVSMHLWFQTSTILGRIANVAAMVDSDLYVLYELSDSSYEANTQSTACANFLTFCMFCLKLSFEYSPYSSLMLFCRQSSHLVPRQAAGPTHQPNLRWCRCQRSRPTYGGRKVVSVPLSAAGQLIARNKVLFLRSECQFNLIYLCELQSLTTVYMYSVEQAAREEQGAADLWRTPQSSSLCGRLPSQEALFCAVRSLMLMFLPALLCSISSLKPTFKEFLFFCSSLLSWNVSFRKLKSFFVFKYFRYSY